MMAMSSLVRNGSPVFGKSTLGWHFGSWMQMVGSGKGQIMAEEIP